MSKVKVFINGRGVFVRGDNGNKRYPLGTIPADAIADYIGGGDIPVINSASEKNNDVVVQSVEEKRTEERKKYTKESLVAMNRKQLNDIAEEMDIERLLGKQFKYCKNGELEDAILEAQAKEIK